MEHLKRVRLAETILYSLKEKYQDQILVGGFYGSTARNEDTELSDLDMILITKNGSKDIEKEFLFKNIPISYRSVEIHEAEDMIKNPDFSWPWTINSIINLRVIVGNEKVRDDLKDLIKEVTRKDCKKAIENQLPNIYAYYNKLKRYHQNDDLNNLLFAMWDFLNGILGCIALLNKQYFIRNDFYRFEESFQYDKTPENYEKLVKKCYSSKNPDEIIHSLDELFDNFEELLDAEDIAVDRFVQTETIDI